MPRHDVISATAKVHPVDDDPHSDDDPPSVKLDPDKPPRRTPPATNAAAAAIALGKRVVSLAALFAVATLALQVPCTHTRQPGQH